VKVQVTTKQLTSLQVKVPDIFLTPLQLKSSYKLLSTCNEVLLLRYLTLHMTFRKKHFVLL